ncbi:Helicase conserved C-terminal domain-containing protein [Prosthecobacter debontii]|uniref:Helicase conserved C-terminal domain-containing protein n=2 Tax=Prosthecobacter debontii TaxID=48467 RepID=A0A1T4X7X8_9BACT|nr:Helicase conserved C-terminal domain-containing protein [Prosthecobacter debontii]
MAALSRPQACSQVSKTTRTLFVVWKAQSSRMSTPYHAKYLAHELTKRCPSDSVQKLAASLADAQVDLNPHQIDAALFAFRSPLSRGAILADEVGLGKTIEAGILLSQKWAERKRRLLIIVPANLRKQWSQELADKFFLPSIILEAKSFNQFIKQGNLNPLDQPSIVICSYHFARAKDSYLKQVSWDLVIIDEAHRLRNVYKPTNRIANAIKAAVAHAPKVLLTATPLQNSLQELYGLVSIIDDYTFGDIKSFKSQFASLRNDDDFRSLRERLKQVCQRTLRRQVLEYIKYTNRIPITQEFYPTQEEQELYDLVSDYLQADQLYALPSSRRQLMTMIVRKLLASSTFAISGTLEALAARLEAAAVQNAPAEVAQCDPGEVAPDYDTVDETEEEWTDEEEKQAEKAAYTAEDLARIKNEVALLRRFTALAKSIQKNSKGESLLQALSAGFSAATEAQRRGSAPTLNAKAIIFTESTRTQSYLLQLLEGAGYKGRVVLFNGTNSDQRSKQIYRNWIERHKGTDRVTGSPSADMRAALVDCFRDEAIIMIATEAAAEGINLQFCNLVVNYDLPWNPQRIEQRIGRCHRYGQKYDVVVVNFLNKSNAADQRVYQLLRDKFKLFDGVFGASDEVLGSIESGVDFEKRIASIYQTCRTPEQIDFNFNQLQQELEGQIDERISQTRQQLLENFDEEVQEKLRVGKARAEETLSRFEQWLWQITRFYLRDHAQFADEGHSFQLVQNPFPEERIHPGPYRTGKNVEDANLYRVGHPLAQRIIESCQKLETPDAEVVFSASGRNIAALDALKGKSGWLSACVLTVSAFETEDHLLLAGRTDDGELVGQDQLQRLFSLPAQSVTAVTSDESATLALRAELERHKKAILVNLSEKNGKFFEEELEKLDRWGEDQRNSLKTRLKELEDQIKEAKRSSRLAANLPEKLALEREKRNLDTKRDEAWKEYEEAAKAIEAKKDSLIDEVERRLGQQVQFKSLFNLKWRLA